MSSSVVRGGIYHRVLESRCPTAHRRFTAWTQADLWQLHQMVLDELVSRGLIDWPRTVLDAASVRAKKGIY